MYKIPMPYIREVWNYYTQYKDIVVSKIREVLSPGFVIEWPKRRKTFKVIVRDDSCLRVMLEWLLEKNNLFCLFGADVEYMVLLIKIVEVFYPDFRETPSKRKYPNAKRGECIEDINAVCNYIFVQSIYDGKKKGKSIFQKADFVKSKDLIICPYCGAAEIEQIRREHGNGGIAYTPPIDHYFPKSKYPFLALEYFNMIPCCQRCNGLPNKGTFDPYAKDIEKLKLMYPYRFKENAFSFYFEYDGSGQYEKKNFTAHIDYKGNKHLVSGYTDGIALEDQYINDIEMKNIWTIVQGHCAKGFSVLLNSALDIAKSDIEMAFTTADIERYLNGFSCSNLIGYEWSDAESRQQLKYKYKKDILRQMISLIGPS